MTSYKNFFASLLSFNEKELEEEVPEKKPDPKKEESMAKKSGANGNKKQSRGTGKGKKESISVDVAGSEAATSVQAAGMEAASEGGEPSTATSTSTRLRMPLVWIDLEMSGLDLEKDRILEIACIVTDGRLEKMIEGPDLVIQQPEEVLAGMGQWCQDHHKASGLVDGVRSSTLSEEAAEEEVLQFVRKHTTGPGQPLLAGNSVYVDLKFLTKYMPRLAAEFSHVLVDVSSVRALCVRWYPRDAERQPAKKQQHRALEDIKESIAELKYLRRTIFKQQNPK